MAHLVRVSDEFSGVAVFFVELGGLCSREAILHVEKVMRELVLVKERVSVDDDTLRYLA